MSTNLCLYSNKKDINKLINFINPLQKTIVLDESRIFFPKFTFCIFIYLEYCIFYFFDFKILFYAIVEIH